MSQLATCASNIVHLSNDELKRGFNEAISLSIESIARAAFFLREMEKRGMDLSDIEAPIVGWIRMIAYGRLLAEAFVKLYGNESILRCAAKLRETDQRHIAAGGSISVAILRGNAVDSWICKDVANMSAAVSRQVFDGDHIRSIEEQASYLRSRYAGAPVEKTFVRLDRRRVGVSVSGLFIPLADLKSYVQELEA
jgi:hypothetical protein